MKPLLNYILITARRDWLYIGLFVTLMISMGISAILGGTALVEKQQMGISYIAGSSRIIIVLGMILFISFHVRRSFDNREIEFLLSHNISRNNLIVSYFCGFFMVAFFILVMFICIFIIFIDIANYLGLLLWFVSLLLELAIVISFTILASLILKSAVFSVLSSAGFYILSRMMGFFVLMISRERLKMLTRFEDISDLPEPILKVISVIVPRLDLFTKTEWLIYDVKSITQFEIVIVAIQAMIYIALMFFMACYDFRRKQF